MQLYDILTGEKARQFCETTLNMTVADYDLNALDRVEVFGSGLTEAGPDYCEFRVYNQADKLMALRREQGY